MVSLTNYQFSFVPNLNFNVSEPVLEDDLEVYNFNSAAPCTNQCDVLQNMLFALVPPEHL